MSSVTSVLPKTPIHYPECDGLPMADYTKQFRWIVTIQGGLDALFRDNPDVFVAGNLLWYPVEGNNTTCAAPDAFVAFGRPKGDRGSYLQWLEGGIAPHVVFEVLSLGNRHGKLVAKFKFFEKYGVQEYYVYDPDTGELSGWLRNKGELIQVDDMQGFTSPLLKVHFAVIGEDLLLTGPDGKKFATYVELVEEREKAELELKKVERQKEKALRDKDKAERDKDKAEREKDKAIKRAEQLAAKLKELGVDPE